MHNRHASPSHSVRVPLVTGRDCTHITPQAFLKLLQVWLLVSGNEQDREPVVFHELLCLCHHLCGGGEAHLWGHCPLWRKVLETLKGLHVTAAAGCVLTGVGLGEGEERGGRGGEERGGRRGEGGEGRRGDGRGGEGGGGEGGEERGGEERGVKGECEHSHFQEGMYNKACVKTWACASLCVCVHAHECGL